MFDMNVADFLSLILIPTVNSSHDPENSGQLVTEKYLWRVDPATSWLAFLCYNSKQA